MKLFPSLLTSIPPLRLPSLRKAHRLKGRLVGDHFPLKKKKERAGWDLGTSFIKLLY
jgi:hypothetical protein